MSTKIKIDKSKEIQYLESDETYLWDTLKSDFNFTEEDRQTMIQNIKADKPLFLGTSVDAMRHDIHDLQSDLADTEEALDRNADQIQSLTIENDKLRDKLITDYKNRIDKLLLAGVSGKVLKEVYDADEVLKGKVRMSIELDADERKRVIEVFDQ
ncbi:MAG: hypothetical protein GF388_02480 [Candidatus Aegiribacteria sp.]|nr:hypothetical protein [Candidatus Aegiribacteria sp.]